MVQAARRLKEVLALQHLLLGVYPRKSARLGSLGGGGGGNDGDTTTERDLGVDVTPLEDELDDELGSDRGTGDGSN